MEGAGLWACLDQAGKGQGYQEAGLSGLKSGGGNNAGGGTGLSGWLGVGHESQGLSARRGVADSWTRGCRTQWLPLAPGSWETSGAWVWGSLGVEVGQTGVGVGEEALHGRVQGRKPARGQFALAAPIPIPTPKPTPTPTLLQRRAWAAVLCFGLSRSQDGSWQPTSCGRTTRASCDLQFLLPGGWGAHSGEHGTPHTPHFEDAGRWGPRSCSPVLAL